MELCFAKDLLVLSLTERNNSAFWSFPYSLLLRLVLSPPPTSSIYF